MAEHIPVHLGVMPQALNGHLAGRQAPPDAGELVINDPYSGANQLLDIILAAHSTSVRRWWATQVRCHATTTWVASSREACQVKLRRSSKKATGLLRSRPGGTGGCHPPGGTSLRRTPDSPHSELRIFTPKRAHCEPRRPGCRSYARSTASNW